jgi:hypothetical protein
MRMMIKIVIRRGKYSFVTTEGKKKNKRLKLGSGQAYDRSSD